MQGFIEKWREQIEALVKSHARYRVLLDAMSGPYFDEDDRKLVKERLAAVETQLANWKETFEKREKLYETTVKELAKVVVQRQRILEQVDSQTQLFSLDEELLDTLARRQRELQEKLEDFMQQLQEIPAA